MVAGARTSAQMRSASCPPIPPDVIVAPAARPSSSGGTGWSRGWGSAMRRRVYSTTASGELVGFLRVLVHRLHRSDLERPDRALARPARRTSGAGYATSSAQNPA